MRNKNIIILALSLILSSYLKAQESVNSSGGDAIGIGGEVSYSIGQVAYTTSFASPSSVAQGVQHAYEIFSVGVDHVNNDLSVSIYPNPATDKITLQLGESKYGDLFYNIYNMEGKTIDSGSLSYPKNQISTNLFKPSVYYLEIVTSQKKQVRVYKIIKN